MRTRATSPFAVLSAVVIAATLTTATSAAAQQRAADTTKAPRVLVTYGFRNVSTNMAFPSRVTVADSAGTIVASATLEGQPKPLPMTVTILNSDLVLQGETPDGVLTLQFNRQNEGDETIPLNGRWMMGKVEGPLRGRIAKP